MDNWLAVVGTLLLGVVGVVAFFALGAEPAQPKTRSAGGMRPRDDWHAQ